MIEEYKNAREGSINYEAEYERLMAELEKAKCEIMYMRDRAKEADRENVVLRAKLEMVELIFGGN